MNLTFWTRFTRLYRQSLTLLPALLFSLQAAWAESVPAEYSALYRTLETSLQDWQRILDRQPAATTKPLLGAHLLAANGNRGEALLLPTTLPMVDASLDRLKQLGIDGVTVSIHFPLFNADYPRSAEYVQFYKKVAEHIRERGLYFTVEQHIAFSGTVFSPIAFDFKTLRFEQFVALDRAMTQLILEQFQPDALTLLSEPDTFARLTGYRQVLDPTQAARMVDQIAAGLPRGKTKLGAGCGSWVRNAPDFAQAFAASTMDYYSLHIYPIGAHPLVNAQAVVDIFKAAGKPVILDEAWLYKMKPGEAMDDFNAVAEVYRRDAFRFWQQLDIQFLDAVTQFARQNGVTYVAPFWSTFFWAYADYTPETSRLPYNALKQRVNRAATAAIRAGTYSPTGEAWGRMSR